MVEPLKPAETPAAMGAAVLRRMVETGDRGPTLHPVEEPGEQTSLLDGPQTGATSDPSGAPKWTEGELRVMGEQVRDYLRKVGRRAVAAFVRGGIERGDAQLYVHEDMQTVADEMWRAPRTLKAGHRPGHRVPAPERGGREDTSSA